jgi:1-acyl-sn-glycerol-3-phosphate acyltransferase
MNKHSNPNFFSRYSWAGRLFGHFWATWALVSFVATFLLIFLPSMVSYLMPFRMGQAYFIFVSRIWMRTWLTLVGCPVRIRGYEHFVPGEAYVIVFNHNAFLDVPLSAPFVPGPNKTIAKDSFAKVPIFGFFYRRGSVLVNRNNEISRRRSYEQMRQVLAAGVHMCIYPEGTRNRSKEPLKPFYDGAFKLGQETGKSILPCVITGTRKAMPHDIPFVFYPTRLGMYFLPPVSTAQGSVESVKNQVFEQMKSTYMERS